MGTLYVVATPIGNLSDISERAKTTLASVSVILCEDTRVTKKLLDVFAIKTPVLSYHQHSGLAKTQEILKRLEAGENLALVTDAGTPTISDPGGKLIEMIVTRFNDSVWIVPIPGPSAVTAALSVSGFPADQFVFLGFPPQKKGRQKFFNELSALDRTAVFYESTHRILNALDEIRKRMPKRPLFVARELTKLHETLYRGTADEVTVQLKRSSLKGEFVIICPAFISPRRFHT